MPGGQEGSAEQLTMCELKRVMVAHHNARRAARRLSENDAWLVATAASIDADIVGADRAAFERLGTRYLRCR